MCSTPTGLFGEAVDYETDTPNSALDGLGMSNSATKATEVNIATTLVYVADCN